MIRAMVVKRPDTRRDLAIKSGWGFQSDRYYTVRAEDGTLACCETGKGMPVGAQVGDRGWLMFVPRAPGGKVMRPVFRPDEVWS